MTIEPTRKETTMDMTNDEWDDATADIAYTIGAELASEYDLWLHKPDDALKVWTAVASFARRQTRLARAQLAATTPETPS